MSMTLIVSILLNFSWARMAAVNSSRDTWKGRMEWGEAVIMGNIKGLLCSWLHLFKLYK